MRRLCCLLVVLLGSPLYAADRPNIILILTDDQGWTTTEVPMMRGRPDTRTDFFQTPNIKRLAEAGMVFSQAYAPHPVCSPSRHSIQFGTTPAKLRKTTNAAENYPTPFQTPAIPQVLKSIDPKYKAAHFGKWHMFGEPKDLGYDASDGRTGNETGRHTTLDQTQFWPQDDPKLMNGITDRSIAFMQAQVAEKNPFYLQVSHYAVHLNIEARQASLDKHKARQPGQRHGAYYYAAMFDDMDQAIGRLLDAVDELKISDNTYIIYTSDNGGTDRQFPDMNKPLRGGKVSFYEGGTRVCFFARGPGIKPGSYCTTPITGYDLLATFADLAAGQAVAPGLPPQSEGGSIKPLLLAGDQGIVSRPREGLLSYSKETAVLVIGSIKLKRANGTGKLELYDLSADLGEQHDLSAEKPDQAKAMNLKLQQWIDEVGAAKPAPSPPPGAKKKGKALD